jgi:hypothetical protein
MNAGLWKIGSGSAAVRRPGMPIGGYQALELVD